MARIGLSITKSTAFRNSTQEFSNVYYYGNGAGQLPNATDAESLLDTLVTLEKAIHSTAVTFVRGRVWSQVGTPSQNEMIVQKNLSGTGSRTQVTSLDKERAFLFRIRAGVDTRGNPVYLRKWYHACGEFVTGQGISAGILAGTSGWSTAERDAQANAMNSIKNFVVNGVTWNLVSKSGRDYGAGNNFTAHQFLEHHQLGDQWRAQ
jgi:hypothetical protein